jgi:hypothetical protein
VQSAHAGVVEDVDVILIADYAAMQIVDTASEPCASGHHQKKQYNDWKNFFHA